MGFSMQANDIRERTERPRRRIERGSVGGKRSEEALSRPTALSAGDEREVSRKTGSHHWDQACPEQ
jgi:hypothetical protein